MTLIERAVIAVGLLASLAPAEEPSFQWECSPPLIAPEPGRKDNCVSIKDPTVVQFQGKWHVFATIRSENRTHQIEYLNFEKWEDANKAERHVLKTSNGYFCAPQVFYFTPHKKWYLIYQISVPGRAVELQPAYSTNDDISNPESWSRPVPLFAEHPANVRMWIDFWVICSGEKAHLFFTSLDGKMWRSESSRAEFPHGWKEPAVCLEGDIFEASHTYAFKDKSGFLTLVEAQGPEGRRYYKAYKSERLDGQWVPLAASYKNAFASPAKVNFSGTKWTDSFSHGELLRAGYDEKMEISNDLVFLFQGVTDEERQGRNYGAIPWRLGVLRSKHL